jgi:hypothetical protein
LQLRDVVSQHDLGNTLIPTDRVDLGLFMDDHVGGCPDPTRQVLRHARPQRAANEQMHRAISTAVRQKHDRLSGRIAPADNRDVGAVINVGFNRRAGVIAARAREAIGPHGFQAYGPRQTPFDACYNATVPSFRGKQKGGTLIGANYH